MKQHLFGDTENTFNLLKRIFNKLLIKNSYFLSTAREVPEFGIFFCSAFSHIRTEQKFYCVNLQIQLKYGKIRIRKRLWARTVSTHWNVIWHFSYERPDWFGTCAKAVILFQINSSFEIMHKLLKGALPGQRQFLITEPFKNDEKCSLFLLKNSFCH